MKNPIEEHFTEESVMAALCPLGITPRNINDIFFFFVLFVSLNVHQIRNLYNNKWNKIIGKTIALNKKLKEKVNVWPIGPVNNLSIKRGRGSDKSCHERAFVFVFVCMEFICDDLFSYIVENAKNNLFCCFVVGYKNILLLFLSISNIEKCIYKKKKG